MSSALAQRSNGYAAPGVLDDAEDLRESPGALESYTRAEIDVQIATAHKFPRSAARAFNNALSLATLNEEIAAGCGYAKPQAGGHVSGPSVRLAEIMASCWGNMRTTARITSEDSRFLTAQAVCVDLETNNGVSIEVKRRITDRNGKKYSDDMIVNTSNAAISIAFRNAVFRVVPRSLVDAVYGETKRVAAGETKTLAERRSLALEYFAELGIPTARICETLAVAGPADIGLDKLAILQGLRTSHRDGETLESLFPEPTTEVAPEAPARGSQGVLDRLKGRGAAKAPAEPPEPGSNG